MPDAMAVLRRVVGFLLITLWLVVTIAFVVALRLMSLDEEWQGWTEAVPLVVFFGLLTLLAWAATWRLLRNRG